MRKLFAMVAVVGGLVIPMSAQTAEFTLLIYEAPGELAKRTDATQADAYWHAYGEFATTLATAGVLRGGSALSEREQVTIGNLAASAGAKQGAQLGGYFIIDVADINAAKRWAEMAPPSALAIEVRPHRANPAMAAK